jgi:hypothetical protein
VRATIVELDEATPKRRQLALDLVSELSGFRRSERRPPGGGLGY